VFPATGGQVAPEAVASLRTAAGTDETHTVAVRTGKGVVFLDLSPDPGGYRIPAYSSHSAVTRQSVVAEA